MGRADRASGAFWFIFSIFIAYESYHLGLGSLHEPGPGSFFFLAGIVTAFLSLTIILRSFKTGRPEEAKGAAFEKRGMAKIVAVLLSLFLYAMLMEWLGFLIVTFLLFTFILRIIEKKKWWLTIPVSLIVTAISYLIFEVGLQSQLPKGVLEFLRF
jgi:putative tricarboxylic transport membrane protein